MVKIGIVGGTGCGGFNVENIEKVKDKQRLTVDTVWGRPSDTLTCGTLNGIPVVLLGRHGPGHVFRPTDVPYRANIQAFKDAGCTHILATTACGSLVEEMGPGDVVLLDQFIDWTTKRAASFFDGSGPSDRGDWNRVTHVAMADAFDDKTRAILTECCQQLGIRHHGAGTMITIEGPRFSTRAESRMFRVLGAHLVNMTTATEAALAKEAGLIYSSIATVTDYDSWREGSDVSVEDIVENAKKSQANTFEIICRAVTQIAEENWDEVLKKLSDQIEGGRM